MLELRSGGGALAIEGERERGREGEREGGIVLFLLSQSLERKRSPPRSSVFVVVVDVSGLVEGGGRWQRLRLLSSSCRRLS